MGFVKKARNLLKKGIKGTGLAFSTVMALVTLGFLIFPHLGLYWTLLVYLGAIPVILAGALYVILSDWTHREIDEVRYFVAFFSLSVGLINMLLAFAQGSLFWSIFNAVSMLMTAWFLVTTTLTKW